MASSAARPLQDQKALVTGGSSGIRAASARALARAGGAVGPARAVAPHPQ